MSDVRVNLLPGDVEARNEAARQRRAAGVAVVAILLLLVAGYLWQAGQVRDAEERLAAEQQTLAELQAEAAALQEYADLGQRRDDAEATLAFAMRPETSYAGILQDVAAVFPDDAELSSLSINTIAVEAGDTDVTLGDVRLAYGQVTATGRTLARFAPGVERLLLDFGKIRAFTEVFLTSSVLDEDDAVAFQVEIDLGEEIRTRRYADGIPEELR